MKILQMVQTLDPSSGGVARAVLSLSIALVRRGHEVEVVTLDDVLAPWAQSTALRIHPLGLGLTSYRYSPRLRPWLRAHGHRFDRVIVHGIWQYLSFSAWRRFAHSSTPYYVFPHGMLDPWFKRTFPLKHLKKWLSWPWADYRVLRDARAVIFTSEEERLEARKSFWLYRAREKVSPLGVEASTTEEARPNNSFLEKYPTLRDTCILLFLGRLHPKKGCDILIDAFSQFTKSEQRLSLVLAGPDQIRWEKQLRVRATGLDRRIVFTGMLEGEIKRSAFAAAAAFILPSHQENFGMAVAEALSFGVPVLISNRVNIWREIDADEAGFVESDDLSGTKRLIERWLHTTGEVRAEMRGNARRCFESRFEINRAAGSLLTILNEAAAI
ncbi:MAG TPA: glycosyltransferase [Chthoniobacterales bacterium]|nr:glycosyltransferase [Chthoniobacterales bacterium]